VNTLIPEEFGKFIEKQVDKNEKKFVAKREMVVDADSKFIELFRKTDLVASKYHYHSFVYIGEKGKFHSLVSGFRKRKREKMEKSEKEKEYDDLKELKKKNKKAIEDLKRKLSEFEGLQLECEENNSKLSKLFELGVVNANGDYIGDKDDAEDDMR
jgi:hypothetical protein